MDGEAGGIQFEQKADLLIAIVRHPTSSESCHASDDDVGQLYNSKRL